MLLQSQSKLGVAIEMTAANRQSAKRSRDLAYPAIDTVLVGFMEFRKSLGPKASRAINYAILQLRAGSIRDALMTQFPIRSSAC